MTAIVALVIILSAVVLIAASIPTSLTKTAKTNNLVVTTRYRH